jgi:hypothetical protein
MPEGAVEVSHLKHHRLPLVELVAELPDVVLGLDAAEE